MFEDDEQAGFSISKVDYSPMRPIIHLVTANNTLVMALDNGKLIKLDLRATSDLRDVDVGPPIRKLFLDPTGNHLIISTTEDTQYLNKSWDKPKPLKLQKGAGIVTSVGWDLDNIDSITTGNILIGTNLGTIYEVFIEAVTGMLKSMERHVKLIYSFQDTDRSPSTTTPNQTGSIFYNAGGNQSGPMYPTASSIEGLFWFRVSGNRNTSYVIFAASATRIWQFIGLNSLESTMLGYNNSSTYGVFHHLGHEASAVKSVSLQVFQKHVDQHTFASPSALAWFMAPTVANTLVGGNAHGGMPAFVEGSWMAALQLSSLGASLASAITPATLPSSSNAGPLSSGGGGALATLTGVASASAAVVAGAISGAASSAGVATTGSSTGTSMINANVVDSFKHVPFADKPPECVSVSMVLTEFHYIIVYHNGLIQFVSRLTNEIVFEGKCNIGRSSMRGMAHDPRTNITFAYTDNQLFEIHISQEDRNVWKMYLRNNQYALAIQYAHEDWQRDQINTARADNQFNQKQYKIAAELYALTSRSFEEVTLKFINDNAIPALMVYLKEKLKRIYKPHQVSSSGAVSAGGGAGIGQNPNLQQSSGDMQCTVLCTWLTELFLSRMNELEAQRIVLVGNAAASPSTNAQVAVSAANASSNIQSIQNELKALQEDFKDFIATYEPCLNKATTLNLITSYGRVEEFLEFSRVVKAWDTIVSYHMQQGDFKSALNEMRIRRNADLFYKHCPILFQNAPQPTVDVLLEMPMELVNPRLLIPALMRHPKPPPRSLPNQPPFVNHAIRYLEFCVKKLGNKDVAVHNYLVSLYAESDDTTLTSASEQSKTSEQRLIEFINTYSPFFDLEYALKLCEKHGKVKPQVALYSKMGLFEEAVHLALKSNDIELAKNITDTVTKDNERRKKLWLEIAKHVIKGDGGQDIKKVMQFIQQSDLLKIEDVLPEFPAFVIINDFKDEICKSLKEYNRHIEDLVLEIEESTQAAQEIRSQIDSLSHKFGSVTSNQSCDLCNSLILSKSFYLFPCSHVFHQNCLVDHIKKILVQSSNSTQLHRLTVLVEEQRRRKLIAYQQWAAEREALVNSQSPPPPVIPTSGLSSLIDSARDGILSTSVLGGLNLPFGTNATTGNPGGSRLPFMPSGNPNVSYLNSSLSPSGQSAINAAVTMPVSSWPEKLLLDEIDNHVAVECPYCGDTMIESVSRPLVDQKSAASWDLTGLNLGR